MRGVLWPTLAVLGVWSFSCGEATPTFREIDTTHDARDASAHMSPPPGKFPDDDNTGSLAIGDASFVPLLGEDDTCLGEVREAEHLDVDLFVMLDRSGSMEDLTGNITKWEAVTSALTEFLENPETAAVGVGLGLFPLLLENIPLECYDDEDCGTGGPCAIPGLCPDGSFCSSDFGCPHAANPNRTGYCVDNPDLACDPGSNCLAGGPCAAIQCSNGYCEDDSSYACVRGETCRDSNGNSLGLCLALPGYCRAGDSCNADDYAAPNVPITLGADRNSALFSVLADTAPGGFTPTAPALEGAIDYARTWYQDHPGRIAAVVLATDGFPSECEVSLSDPVQAVLAQARAGVASSPPIRTYVIGVFSEAENMYLGASDILQSMAEAGDTEEAFLVDAQGDVSDAFLTALQSISATAISCEFLLPTEEELDLGQVNLRLTDADDKQVQLVNVGSLEGCDDGGERGWYYVEDESGEPFQISVCPEICRQFSRNGGGLVDLQIGCETIIR